MELSKHVEHLINPALGNAGSLISNYCLKPCIVYLEGLLLKFAHTDVNADLAVFLVVFYRILYQVEDDELVDPPIGAHRHV